MEAGESRQGNDVELLITSKLNFVITVYPDTLTQAAESGYICWNLTGFYLEKYENYKDHIKSKLKPIDLKSGGVPLTPFEGHGQHL